MISQVEQDLGRAKNAVQDFLVRKLLVPKIYLDARWSGVPLDVLAIDRAGVGDVHAVRIAPVRFDDGPVNRKELSVLADIFLKERSPEILPLSLHYKHFAVLSETADLRRYEPEEALIPALTAADGVGRIGVLVLDFADGEASIRVAVRAERFRSPREIVDLADRYVAEHTANWEIRE